MNEKELHKYKHGFLTAVKNDDHDFIGGFIANGLVNEDLPYSENNKPYKPLDVIISIGDLNLAKLFIRMNANIYDLLPTTKKLYWSAVRELEEYGKYFVSYRPYNIKKAEQKAVDPNFVRKVFVKTNKQWLLQMKKTKTYKELTAFLELKYEIFMRPSTLRKYLATC